MNGLENKNGELRGKHTPLGVNDKIEELEQRIRKLETTILILKESYSIDKNEYVEVYFA